MSTTLEWVDTLSGPGGILVGILGTTLFARSKSRQELRVSKASETKIDAEAAKILADTAMTLVAPLQAQVTDLILRVSTLEAENAVTRDKLQIAIDHIRELLIFIKNHVPHMTPPTAPNGLGL